MSKEMSRPLSTPELTQIAIAVTDMFGPTAKYDPTERLDFLSRTALQLLAEVHRLRKHECDGTCVQKRHERA